MGGRSPWWAPLDLCNVQAPLRTPVPLTKRQPIRGWNEASPSRGHEAPAGCRLRGRWLPPALDVLLGGATGLPVTVDSSSSYRPAGGAPPHSGRDGAQQAWQNHLLRPVSPPRLPRRTLETAQTSHRCGFTDQQPFLHFLPEAPPSMPLRPGGRAQPLGGLLRHGSPSAGDPASLPALPPVSRPWPSHPQPLAALSDLRLHLGPRLPSLPG